ncbi:calcium-binding protein [Aestuariibacter sp. A3R04]|uniref:calcium-binding protein n=1 Tax=Aestuariibacter sp. A3R04 TaxID=2841571 RepID=UPI001C080255|nr:calcium-binding protein [Aestuariibacter sp. A3R04]MBU3021950.1 calcium-binding protein [Aestuariibacter sp. A3R04]
MFKKILTVSIVAMAFNGYLEAAPHSASGIILTYDLNSDETLSMEEFVAARRARFIATDTNKNGTIEEGEYVYEWEGTLSARMAADRKASVKQTHIRFNAIDKNDDGFIAKSELDAVGEKGFTRLDKDKDGVIRATDPDPENTSTSDKPRLEQRAMLRMPTTHNVAGFMGLYDTNGDDVVDSAEFQAVRDAHFQRTDENGDGKLTEQEYVLEFEDRLDKQYEKTYDRQIKQTYVRFGVLDTDENGRMTFNEYMRSGMRAFMRYDTSGDGILSLADPAPVRKAPVDTASDPRQTNTAQVTR